MKRIAMFLVVVVLMILGANWSLGWYYENTERVPGRIRQIIAKLLPNLPR